MKHFRVFALFMFLGIWTSSSSGAASAPPPTGAVRIESLTHTVRAPLNLLERVSVTLRGSAGGTAAFTIPGVAAEVPMREVRPGTYQAQPALYIGAYTVQRGDAVRNGAVVATLKVGDREVSGVTERPVTVDTRPPTITSRQPKPEARLTNARPNFVVTFFDGESLVNPGAVRMVVNGRNVSSQLAISDNAATYNPEVAFGTGRVRVSVTVTDRARNASAAEWNFVVASGDGLIKSVTVNPPTALKAREVLSVVMSGEPGGAASFTIEGLQQIFPMRESQTPGLYFGSYEVRSGQNVIAAAVVVTLRRGARTATVPASSGLTILTSPPPAPVVSAVGVVSGPAETAGSRRLLRGRSQPGARILGRVSYEAPMGVGADQGTLYEFSTLVASQGTWQARIGPFPRLRSGKLSVTVIAIDPAGQRSPPAVVELAE